MQDLVGHGEALDLILSSSEYNQSFKPENNRMHVYKRSPWLLHSELRQRIRKYTQEMDYNTLRKRWGDGEK